MGMVVEARKEEMWFDCAHQPGDEQNLNSARAERPAFANTTHLEILHQQLEIHRASVVRHVLGGYQHR